MRWRGCAAAGLVALGPAIGCGGRGPAPPVAPAPASRTYTLKGVVRKVDAASGEVTIAHQALPGFMPAMTMPFTIKDKGDLEDVRPGDEVEGPLRVELSAAGEVRDYDLAGLAVTRPAAEAPPPPAAAAAPGDPTVLLRVGDPVPDFAVTTQDGRSLRLSDLRGEVVALTFIYTRCPLPDFCPAIDAKFADLARRVSVAPGRSDRVRLLSVSFDPGHDTPAVLAAHARRRGARPPLWTFAVASEGELARVAGPLGLTVAPGSGEIAHNLRTAVIGPDGRLARLEAGQGWAPADLVRSIAALIPAAGR